MSIVIIRNGVRTDLSERLRIKEFYVEPLSIAYEEYRVDNGNIINIPVGYNTRRIRATFKFTGYTLDSYAGRLAELRAMFTHRDEFYLIDMHDQTKMWLVRNEGGFPATRVSKSADIEVSFICVNKYAMNIRGTNVITKNWSDNNKSWSEGLSWSETYENSFTTNSFSYNNVGSAPVDPRENPMTITIRGTFNPGLTIINNTNGTRFNYTGNITSSDTLRLFDNRVFLNGLDVRDRTDYGIIVLEAGINEIEVFGGTVSSFAIEHNFYYL